MSPSTSSKTINPIQKSLIFYQYIWNGSFRKNKLMYNIYDEYIGFTCQYPTPHSGTISSKSFVQIFEERKESFMKNPPIAHFFCYSNLGKQCNYRLSDPYHINNHFSFKTQFIDGCPMEILGSGTMIFNLFPNENPFPDADLSSQLMEYKHPAIRTTISQKLTFLTAEEASKKAVEALYSIDTSTTGVATEQIFKDENQEVK